MGLTSQSTGINVLEKELKIIKKNPVDKVIALAGNPNVGKSTVFNNLTGLNQHTGNWPGKTINTTQGNCKHKGENFIMIDLPGTYSLMANSLEEEVARDFICFGNPDATVVVIDATCIERNLNLVLQTLEITSKVVVCVNLIDEAKRKKINVNINTLSNLIGVPVVATNARTGTGLNELMDAIYNITVNKEIHSPVKITYDEYIEQAINMVSPAINNRLENNMNCRWISLKLIDGDETLIKSLNKYLNIDIENRNIENKLKEAKEYLEKENIDTSVFRDTIVSQIVRTAEKISGCSVTYNNYKYNIFDRKIDNILTSKVFGIPIMIGLLALVFWITITGANLPSALLAKGLFWCENKLMIFLTYINTPLWLKNIFVMGIYRTLAWVISVMLPPMAIFFPLFTLLEDLGYLPRIAFNLDNYFKKACAHGKQALTMCMGFGCNAAGIVGCRIIDSPRERLIATITNNFVPCNGRFPTLIAIITMFFLKAYTGPFKTIVSALLLTSIILLGILITLSISKILSKTFLKGLPSSFTLELPPYRRPQVGKILIRSILDRTLFVLGRAAVVAAPSGAIIWLLANIYFSNQSLLSLFAELLNPFAWLIGLDGYILMAFILGFPANEIVIPIVIMSYMSTGNILELDNLTQLRMLLVSNGWTWLTALCVMLFTLMHWPCGTTCLTIKKETQSIKWTMLSIIVPTITGIVICFIVANTARLLGLA
jgi:ferrous iron transport protein B